MTHSKIIIYEPNQRAKMGWIKTWKTMFINIVNSRELIWQLFRRDFLMAYKKSFFGAAWIFITPIMGIISWVFYNATGILAPGDVGIPYPAYVLLSSTIYGLWGGFQSAASGTLSAGAGFINQVNYPHDALLIKQAMLQFVNFLISFVVIIIVLLVFGVTPSWMIVLLPVLILPLFFLGSAIGLMISLITVVSPDIQRAVNFVLGLVMYITPVIYSPKVQNPTLQVIIKYNPLTYLIGGCRDAIIYGRIDHLGYFLLFSFFTLILFLVAWRLFYVTELRVIEKMI
jgi:lipopolysaccharide transport system permease protein